ncbi:iron-sulfur cluster assembly accessory protein [Buchnera aphidicola]|uniref:iron-sulfur cluster assembly accessory protein n=1 Tax=Buchnera aphidicola TaxID=9 RepID=UPI0030EF75F3
MILKKHFKPLKNKNLNGIFLTKKAYKKICCIIKEKYIGIRLNLKKFGCVGFSHTIKPLKEKIKNDIFFKYKKIIIAIPKSKKKFLDALTIDFIKKKFSKSFKFYHKKIKNTCGCGESVQF